MTKPLTPEQTAAKKLAARTCANCGKVFRKAASIKKFHGWCKPRTEATPATEAEGVTTVEATPKRRSRKTTTITVTEADLTPVPAAKTRKLPVLTTGPVARVQTVNAVPRITRVK